MEASTSSKRTGGRSFRDLTSTREGSLLVALGAALLAGLLLLLFVQRYKDNQNAKGATKSVFVARALIPRGSSADVVASSQLLQRTHRPIADETTRGKRSVVVERNREVLHANRSAEMRALRPAGEVGAVQDEECANDE